jgi:hypothetical protein
VICIQTSVREGRRENREAGRMMRDDDPTLGLSLSSPMAGVLCVRYVSVCCVQEKDNV